MHHLDCCQLGITVVVVVLTALSVGGCGTMANLDGKEYPFISLPYIRQPEPFGGVANDARWAKEQIDMASTTDALCPLHLATAVFFGAVDCPISAVADVVTLPGTLGSPPHDDSH